MAKKENSKETNSVNFISELRGIMKDPKFGEENDCIHVRTGFKIFDYLNGSVIPLKDGSKYFKIGIGSGKQIMIIGKSGSGKTTFALQLGASIIKRYEQSSMFILDFEQSHSRERIRMVTGMTEDELNEKISIKQVGIHTETVLRMAAQIKELKLKNKKALLTDNLEGVLDDNGKPVKILPPTILLVDSIATMLPEKVTDDEGEISGQMLA